MVGATPWKRAMQRNRAEALVEQLHGIALPVDGGALAPIRCPLGKAIRNISEILSACHALTVGFNRINPFLAIFSCSRGRRQ
jgi:hypothetical protein